MFQYETIVSWFEISKVVFYHRKEVFLTDVSEKVGWQSKVSQMSINETCSVFYVYLFLLRTTSFQFNNDLSLTSWSFQVPSAPKLYTEYRMVYCWIFTLETFNFLKLDRTQAEMDRYLPNNKFLLLLKCLKCFVF